jgi:DNA end-binding protein Ku
MQGAGRVAIGRFSTRGKQQLALIRPWREGLVLHGLYYADEVRSFEDIDLGEEVAFKSGELDLANQLIDQLAAERFEPEKYEDEYRQRVLAAVDRKVAGEEVVVAPAEAPAEPIIDLVAALKKSLAGKKGAAKPGLKKVRKPAPRTRAGGERSD